MSRSGAEVAGVELIGSTDLSRGRGRRMERDHDGRHESKRGHATRAGGGDVGATRRSRTGSIILEQKCAMR
jgi:hypothetical protein